MTPPSPSPSPSPDPARGCGRDCRRDELAVGPPVPGRGPGVAGELGGPGGSSGLDGPAPIPAGALDSPGITTPTPTPSQGSAHLAALSAVARAHPPAQAGVGAVIGAIAELAGRQRGVLTRRQLLGLGLSRHAVDRMVATHRLHSLHRGVYALGHTAPAPHATETAALLSLGGDALLSHVTAAALWALAPASPPPAIDVTVVRRRASRRTGIRLHRTAELASRDRRTVLGLPVTSVARTLLDLADLAEVTDWSLERALGEALTQRLVRLGQLDDVLSRAQGRHGAGRLAALLGTVRANGAVMTRSDAEAALLDLLRQAGLPMPKVNARVHGYEVDFLWPEQRLVLELDGFRYHSTPLAFERDRRKTQALTAAGLAVMRSSPRQTEREPFALVARLAQALAVAVAV